jgi:ParB family chromosome partitioning protein
MWQLHERLGEYVDAHTCASLIESMREHGQKQPVLGRRVRQGQGVEIELIYGARRLFAAQHLRCKLRVDVRELDDRAALIEMDIENRVRTDITPYERGLSYRRWLNGGHFRNQAEIARALGVSEAQISRLLRYAAIPAAVIEAFESPADIREDWAVVLAKQCEDPDERQSVLKRARAIALSGSLRTPQAVYATLLRRGSQGLEAAGTHDRVVSDSTGRPLLRIGFRARTIHLILPRDHVTPDVLDDIAEQIRAVLEDKSTPAPHTRRAALTHLRAPHDGRVIPLQRIS